MQVQSKESGRLARLRFAIAFDSAMLQRSGRGKRWGKYRGDLPQG